MSEARQAEMGVVDRDGTRGTLDLAAVPPDGKQSRLVLVRFRGGAQAFISSDALVGLKGGGYFYPESLDEAAARGTDATTDERLVIPVVAEELTVGKRAVERGGVRVVKTVSERVETVDLPLTEERAEVVRVPVNRIVEAAPPVRHEGDVMIVPLVEEVVVAEKRLMLREELHVRKQRVETRRPQQVTLRREEAHVARFPADEADGTE